ncbi:MAG: hypothetical protein ACRDQ2_15225 [Gaiellales bacterium]
MSDKTGDISIALADLDARLREVEALQELTLHILSTRKPLDGLLEHYGATESQEQAFYRLLDEVAARAGGGGQDRPTFEYFAAQIREIFPALRGDREFIGLVIATLKLERPAYRDLHAYTIAEGWSARALDESTVELDQKVLHVRGNAPDPAQ